MCVHGVLRVRCKRNSSSRAHGLGLGSEISSGEKIVPKSAQSVQKFRQTQDKEEIEAKTMTEVKSSVKIKAEQQRPQPKIGPPAQTQTQAQAQARARARASTLCPRVRRQTGTGTRHRQVAKHGACGLALNCNQKSNAATADLAPFATQGRPSQNGMSLGLSGVVPGLENSTPRAVS